MNSEKVKEIKKALSCSAGDFYAEPIDCKLCKFSDKGIYSKCKGWKLAKDSLTLINELESENERLILQYERVKADSEMNCLELKDRIAELEKEIEENAFYSKGYAEGIKNTYEVVIPDKLKQFAERLKEKGQKSFINVGGLTASAKTVTLHDIDEMLKECLCEKHQ